MGMATKLALVGAVGALGLAALGAASAAYNWYFDADSGAERRKGAANVVSGAASKYGLDGLAQASMKSIMESLATAGR